MNITMCNWKKSQILQLEGVIEMIELIVFIQITFEGTIEELLYMKTPPITCINKINWYQSRILFAIQPSYMIGFLQKLSNSILSTQQPMKKKAAAIGQRIGIPDEYKKVTPRTKSILAYRDSISNLLPVLKSS